MCDRSPTTTSSLHTAEDLNNGNVSSCRQGLSLFIERKNYGKLLVDGEKGSSEISSDVKFGDNPEYIHQSYIHLAPRFFHDMISLRITKEPPPRARTGVLVGLSIQPVFCLLLMVFFLPLYKRCPLAPTLHWQTRLTCSCRSLL